MKTIETTDTTECNRLIAEFMGAQDKLFDNEYEMYGIIDCIEDGEGEQHFFEPYDMRFHSSWDWLMPVVGRISETVSGGVTYNVQETLLVADINKTYQAVVEFIQWYNNNIKNWKPA